jgi:hypothetical protein
MGSEDRTHGTQSRATRPPITPVKALTNVTAEPFCLGIPRGGGWISTQSSSLERRSSEDRIHTNH